MRMYVKYGIQHRGLFGFAFKHSCHVSDTFGLRGRCDTVCPLPIICDVRLVRVGEGATLENQLSRACLLLAHIASHRQLVHSLGNEALPDASSGQRLLNGKLVQFPYDERLIENRGSTAFVFGYGGGELVLVDFPKWRRRLVFFVVVC